MLSRLFEPRGEERAISFQSLFAAGDAFQFTTNSGTVVTQEDSLKIGTVYACVRLIADSISTLPVDTYIRVDGDRRPYRPRPEWVDMPEVGVSRTDHFQQVLVSMLLNGNSFTRIIRDEQGVAGLAVLNPLKVEVKRDESRRLIYVYDNQYIIQHEDMIHLSELRLPGDLRGRSRIELVKENLGLSKALEEFAARFFGQGSHTSGIIEFPGNLTREQAKSLVDGFEEGHKGLRRSHRPGILFGGAKYTTTSVAPDDSQFLQSRQFAVEEILRAFRVPPSMAGVIQSGAQAYASVEMNGIHFVMHTLRPYVTKIEDGYSNKLLTNGAFIHPSARAEEVGRSRLRARARERVTSRTRRLTVPTITTVRSRRDSSCVPCTAIDGRCDPVRCASLCFGRDERHSLRDAHTPTVCHQDRRRLLKQTSNQRRVHEVQP